MKARLLILAVLFFLPFLMNAQVPQWAWARGTDTALVTGASGTGTAIDAAGNIYVAISSDHFVSIAKYNASGNVVWVRKSSQTYGTTSAAGIAVDHSGNVVMTGNFTGSITFDTTVISTNGASYEHVFLVKYDSGGHLIFGKNLGLGLLELQLSVDASNSLYFGGAYFSPDTIAGIPLPSPMRLPQSTNYSYGAFTTKIDSNGNGVWAKAATFCNNMFGVSTAIDKAGNVFTTGSYSDTAIFGTDTLPIKQHDNFILKYDNNGNFLWARCLNDSLGSDAVSIATDNAGNVYSYGGAYGYGYYYLSKLDRNGRFLWGKSLKKNVGLQQASCAMMQAMFMPPATVLILFISIISPQLLAQTENIITMAHSL